VRTGALVLERAAPGSLWSRYRTVVLYGVIGCVGILLDLLLFLLLYNVVGIGAQLASAISLSIGITTTFALNSAFNFRTRDVLARRYGRYVAVGLTGMGLIAAALYLFATVGGADPNVVKACSVPFVAAFQYWANSRWTFR
jgi:putative flippase GtrA